MSGSRQGFWVSRGTLPPMDYKSILASQLVAPKKEGGMSVEEALEMQELFLKIREIDLGEVNKERLSGMTALDKLINDLKHEQPIATHRRTVAKKAKPHYKTVQAKRRRKDREYYHEVLKPRRRRALATELLTPEGWWKYLGNTWKQMGTVVELTYEQFLEYVYPMSVGSGYVPIFFRYNPKAPLSLGNILVRDSETRKVLFDGKEHLLREMGCIL
jgi:hypothetical protein